MTLTFNLLLFGFTLLFLAFLLKKNYKFLFIFGLFVFQALTIMPSLIYIEEGIYISEQGRDSYFVWGTLAYTIYFFVSIIVLYATFKTLDKFKTIAPNFVIRGKKIDRKIILWITILSMAILFLNASLSKLPLFDNSITRFDYWENSKMPFLKSIFGNVSIFVPFILGITFKYNKKGSIILMVLYILYNFLIGQKFSPIVSGAFSFFLPIIINYRGRINLKRVFSKRIIVPTLLLIGVMYAVIYDRYEQRTPYAIIKIYDPNEAIIYRAFGLQGHLFWGAVETYVYNDGEHSYNPLDLVNGMHHLMYKFAKNTGGLKDDIAKGFNFTNAYPGILFYVFPIWIGVLVHILFLVAFLGLLGWLLKEFILKRAYLFATITFQLFNWAIYALTMGYFSKLKFSILFLICFGIVSVAVLNLKKKKLI